MVAYQAMVSGVPELFYLLIVILTFLFSNYIFISTRKWWILLLVVVTGVSISVTVFLGGIELMSMALKVLSFVLLLAYALRWPATARLWLVIAIFFQLCVQAVSGNMFDKLSTVPYILLGAIWLASRNFSGTKEFYILAIGFLLEFLQAFLLESRGLLVAVVIVICILLLPLKHVRKLVVIVAITLPIVYPLVLLLANVLILSGSDIVVASSSNIERSAMSAWCIEHLSSFLLFGPGEDYFAGEMNSLMNYFNLASADKYDPHQFLLSVWIWLGTIVMVVLYINWTILWLFGSASSVRFLDPRIRFFGILAIYSILTFTLSPPGSYSRVQVALLTGIALAGLRDPSVLLSRKGSVV